MANQETLKFRTNIPTAITFMYDEPKTGQGQYGTWYLWGVKSDGLEVGMFASEGLQRKLETLGKLYGRTLEITKEEGQDNRTYWRVFENGVEVALSPKSAPRTSQNAKSSVSGQSRDIQKAMQTKSDYIARAQAHKDASMMHLAECRDAVQLTIAEMGQGGAWDDTMIKGKIKYWKDWLHNSVYNLPF